MGCCRIEAISGETALHTNFHHLTDADGDLPERDVASRYAGGAAPRPPILKHAGAGCVRTAKGTDSRPEPRTTQA